MRWQPKKGEINNGNGDLTGVDRKVKVPGHLAGVKETPCWYFQGLISTEELPFEPGALYD